MGFETSDPQRNVMGQSAEMSSLVCMLLRTFLNMKFTDEQYTIINQSTAGCFAPRVL